MSKSKKQKKEIVYPSLENCPEMSDLPTIMEPSGAYEVTVPASVYQPILLTPDQPNIDVGPGKLDENEEKFVRDLMLYINSGNMPDPDKPLLWQGKSLWIKRNIEKDIRSFRLRIDDSDWFYPDFIIWILDPDAKTQTFGFVDPKGLAIGTVGGWSDYKVVSTIYMPHVISLQIDASSHTIKWKGEDWKFRMRGILVSTSDLNKLVAHAKFNLHASDGKDISPTEKDFERARIVFQKNDPSYIETVLKLLIEDTALDSVMEAAARAVHLGSEFKATSEIESDLVLRIGKGLQSHSELIASLIRDYSQATGANKK
jgi:hypothetical protein